MATGRIRPGIFVTAARKLQLGIWPWTTGVRARLPLFYKRRFVEKHMKEPKPVNYRPDPSKYYVDEFGERHKVLNLPIEITYPRESDEGLWGGEGIIDGMRKRNNNPKKPRAVRLWKPFLTNRIFYSEILDKWMPLDVTFRTLNQIDECKGFDYYILQTHEVDLNSKLGMKLKKAMILALINKSSYKDRPDRMAQVYEKYKEFIIPEEEAEWLGLDIYEAEAKQERLEEEERIRNLKPVKNTYLPEFLQKLQANELEEPSSSGGLLSRLNPFKKEENKDLQNSS